MKIKSFYYSSEDPIENLAYDEALLRTNNTNSYLRFWESPTYFIVLGHGNSIKKEVNVSACKKDNIPVLRRCSGGGTVIQGPGCLNYALILPTTDIEFDSISKATSTIMTKNADALTSISKDIHVRGISDLCINNIKFSGNAQRRLKNKFLFHGTFLYNFDLNKINNYLPHPSQEPEYRKQRSHLKFTKNINCNKNELINLITNKWRTIDVSPIKNLDHLITIQQNYSTKEWLFKFP
jgi:lipoate---protein ligase